MRILHRIRAISIVMLCMKLVPSPLTSMSSSLTLPLSTDDYSFIDPVALNPTAQLQLLQNCSLNSNGNTYFLSVLLFCVCCCDYDSCSQRRRIQDEARRTRAFLMQRYLHWNVFSSAQRPSLTLARFFDMAARIQPDERFM